MGFFEGRGIGIEEVEGRRERGGGAGFWGVDKGRDLDRKEKWEKIRESRYNKWYSMIKGKGIPGYLKGWEESRRQRVARFRLGNGIKGNWY